MVLSSFVYDLGAAAASDPERRRVAEPTVPLAHFWTRERNPPDSDRKASRCLPRSVFSSVDLGTDLRCLRCSRRAWHPLPHFEQTPDAAMESHRRCKHIPTEE